MSKAIRITINMVRFIGGVALYVVRSPLAVVAGFVSAFDNLVAAVVNPHTEATSWFGGFLNKAKEAFRIGLITIVVVLSGPISMIESSFSSLLAEFS